MWAFPCPWMPATPTRITSLAPSTRPDALVPATVTTGNAEQAAACFRNPRRVCLCMRGSPGKVGQSTRPAYCQPTEPTSIQPAHRGRARDSLPRVLPRFVLPSYDGPGSILIRARALPALGGGILKDRSHDDKSFE